MRRFRLLFCLTLVSLSTVASGSFGAGLVPDDEMYDFGHIGLEFTVLHDFAFYNEGSQPFTIDSARVTCDCSMASVLDSVVQPGDTGRVRLSFTTTNFYGPNNKILTVYTSDPELPIRQFYYLAIVGQWFNGIKPDPISLFFLPMHDKKRITVTNQKFNHIVMSFADQLDTLLDVTILTPKARRGEKVEAEIVPKANLRAGTYHSSLRLAIATPGEEPVYLTIPVKIVRY
jgi:hypothetical protein